MLSVLSLILNTIARAKSQLAVGTWPTAVVGAVDARLSPPTSRHKDQLKDN